MSIGPHSLRLLEQFFSIASKKPSLNFEKVFNNPVARQAYRDGLNTFYKPRVSSPLEPISRKKFTIPGPSGKLNITQYYPKDKKIEGKVVYVGGGASVVNLGDIYDGPCSIMSEKSRCAIFRVEPRVAPEYNHEESLNDALAAIRHFSEDTKKYGVETNNLIITGNSSGANLATVAVNELYKEMSIAGQVLISPRTDATLRTTREKKYQEQQAQDTMMPISTQEFFLGLCKPSDQSLDDPHFSPLFQTFDDIENYPPTVLICGEYDALRGDTEAYYEKLREAGIDDVSLMIGEGQIHNSLILYKECPDGIDQAILAGEAIQRFCGTRQRQLVP